MRGDAVIAAVLLGDIEKAEKRLARMKSDHAKVVARLDMDDVAEYRERTQHLSTATRAMALGDDLTPPPVSMDNGSAEMDETERRFWEEPSGEHKIFNGLKKLVGH